MKIQKFEDLECWKKARELVRNIYQITKDKSFCRDYALVGQIVSAAISIMNNISEGFDSQSNKEFIRFLRYARRSTSEVQNCLYIAHDQNYIDTAIHLKSTKQIEETRKIIDGLLRYLKKTD